MLFSAALSVSQFRYFKGVGVQTRGTEAHRPRPREVHAVRQTLPHLVTEEADADALQVLGSDLQGHEDSW